MLNEAAQHHFFNAEHLLEQNKVDASIAELEKAVFVAPDYAEAHYNLGVLLERKGQNARAITEYQISIDNAPHLLRAYQNLGALLAKNRRLGRAVKTYQAGIKPFPNSAELHYNLANAFERQGMIGEAIVEYHEAIRIKPSLVQAYNNLGRVLLRKKDWAGAVKAYEGAISIDPNWETVHFGLGCAYARTGRTTEAIAEFRTNLRRNSQNADTLLQLGRCLLIQSIEENSPESVRLAQAALIRARSLQPYNFRIYKAMLDAKKIQQKL